MLRSPQQSEDVRCELMMLFGWHGKVPVLGATSSLCVPCQSSLPTPPPVLSDLQAQR